MTSARNALVAFVLICSAHDASAMLLPSAARFDVSADPLSSMRAPVRLCNGISKHTRTLCCGMRPPVWCGKQPAPGDADAGSAGINGKSDNSVMFILRDPMFYACMIACVTVICLVALAGSGRDHGVEDVV